MLEVPIANPFAYLWSAVNSCTKFADFLKSRLLAKPPSPEEPWSVILYSDEVTPGNPLGNNNKRKFHAIYWSFLELGMNALSREESWFVAMTEYSTIINHKVSAGLSQAFSAIIKAFFEPNGFNMMRSGVNLPFPGGSIRLFANLKIIIQDGGAHKYMFHARGDGATKLCLLCKNVFTEKSMVVDDDGSNLLRSNVINEEDLIPATGREIRRLARYVATKADTLGKGDFTELQQSLGVTYHPHAMLLDKSLDAVFNPTDVYMHDYMHCLFVDGVANLMIYLLFEVFIKNGVHNIYETFGQYLTSWTWPLRLHGSQLAEIFAEGRKDKHRKAKHIKCQASDILSLLSVLALFTRNVLLRTRLRAGAKKCEDACHAFLALAELVDLITITARVNVDPAALRNIVHKFLRLFVAAFGYEWMTPKFHWLLHFAKILARFGVLLNCFVLERKHRLPKRYATDLANTSRHPSVGLLSEVVNHHLSQLDDPEAFSFHVGLVRGGPAPRKTRAKIIEAFELDDTANIKVARTSRFSAVAHCQVNDVVIIRTDHADQIRAGQIELHCEVEGVPISIISAWQLHHYERGTGYAIWHKSETAEYFPTEDIIGAVVFQSLPDNKVGTILPPEYR
jgi:hypothetical protein